MSIKDTSVVSKDNHSIDNNWHRAFIFNRHIHLNIKKNGNRQGRGTHQKENRLKTLLIFLRTFTLVKIMELTN